MTIKGTIQITCFVEIESDCEESELEERISQIEKDPENFIAGDPKSVVFSAWETKATEA